MRMDLGWKYGTRLPGWLHFLKLILPFVPLHHYLALCHMLNHPSVHMKSISDLERRLLRFPKDDVQRVNFQMNHLSGLMADGTCEMQEAIYDRLVLLQEWPSSSLMGPGRTSWLHA